MRWMLETPFDVANRCTRPTGTPHAHADTGIDLLTKRMPHMYAVWPMLCFQSGSPSDNPKRAGLLLALERWLMATPERNCAAMRLWERAVYYVPLVLLALLLALLAKCTVCRWL